jgi:hypothetical protein
MAEHPSGSPADFEELRTILATMSPGNFERLACTLIEDLLDVRLSKANAGYQFGGDAGPVGRAGRRFRIEAKRYTSDFNARDLIGGFQQALMNDENLEAWFPVATRDIPEQIALALENQANLSGVPIIAIGWEDAGVPSLAALCTAAPARVEEMAGARARALVDAITPVCESQLRRLKTELEEWHIGFALLQAAARADLDSMWGSRRASLARFGQDAAGGDHRPLVKRQAASDALDAWWLGRAASDSPAAILGLGGMGKTWAALAWMVARPDLPIIVTIPAGAVSGGGRLTPDRINRLIAERLREITGVRAAGHWQNRVERLLRRPPGQGPVFCILLDGINQNPTPDWLSLLHCLQDAPFSGRVRCLLTTRRLHFDNEMGGLRRLAEPATFFVVDQFDDEPGGEYEQMLAAAGLKREDLDEDLTRFARTPRLFSLVTRLRDRLSEGGRVTVHRLLWEYGRDTLGERAGSSFSDTDWQEWLTNIAHREREGLKIFSAATLAETAARADLEPSQVAARLSDIVDGNFTMATPDGRLQLIPEIVAQALGLALLLYLQQVLQDGSHDTLAALDDWLDPISGLDERAELLRAAASIIAERERETAPQIASAVITAWLQTQNLPPEHLVELHRLAPTQIGPLLSAIEASEGGARQAARQAVVDTLREIDRTNPITYGLIVERCLRWMSIVSRDASHGSEGEEQIEASRTTRWMERVGFDEARAATILGVRLEIVDNDSGRQYIVAQLLDGMPLAGASQIFLRGALTQAIAGHKSYWETFRWLCLLNEVDQQETANALRALADDVAKRVPEEGINPQLPARVAAILHWLTGFATDEDRAFAIDPGIDRSLTYEKDYLPDPGKSFFRLERRHGAQVLTDKTLPVRMRVQRGRELLLDPSFEPPAEFIEDLKAAMEGFDLGQLDVGRFQTSQDHEFETLRPVLARCAPDLLAQIEREKLAGYAARPVEQADSSAWSVHEAILVSTSETAAACRALRLKIGPDTVLLNRTTPSHLLCAELVDASGPAQIEGFLAAEPPALSSDVEEILKPLSARQIDDLIARYRGAEVAQVDHLLILLARGKRAFSEEAWGWLESLAFDARSPHRDSAFTTLGRADRVRFGRLLIDRHWEWSNDESRAARHFGSLAIIAAGMDLSFEQIAPMIAPHLLLRAVRERGTTSRDANMAGAILDRVIMAETAAPDLGAIISINTDQLDQHPFHILLRPSPKKGDEGNPFAELARRTSEDGIEHTRRAITTAIDRMDAARLAGASLFLQSIDARDLTTVVAQCPDLVARWIAGATERGQDFTRRVQLAEGFYVALCEALLVASDARAPTLWRSLVDVTFTNFIDQAGVNELMMMLFRAPPNAVVLALRDELSQLDRINSDKGLLDLSLSAIRNGQQAWLDAMIESDEQSPNNWRKRRAIMLRGFGTAATQPIDGAWPDGSDATADDERRQVAAQRLNRDACARHWWRRFVAAADPISAYAAWVLFQATADRRALAWLSSESWPDADGTELERRKFLQFKLNQDALAKAAEKQESGGEGKFLDRTIIGDIHPWRDAE